MTPDIYRGRVKDTTVAALNARTDVIACWEGGSAAQFLERERHGVPQVQLDRSGKVAALPLDRAALAARRTHRLAQLRGALPI